MSFKGKLSMPSTRWCNNIITIAVHYSTTHLQNLKSEKYILHIRKNNIILRMLQFPL